MKLADLNRGPAVKESSPLHPHRGTEEMRAAAGCEARILIVDDEPGIRNMLSELLHESYECRAAGSAEEALEILRAEQCSLVLTDIRMDGMSGLEMIPLALRCAPDAVIVMISAEQTIDSAIEAMRAGAFDYIKKPFDIRQVEAVIRRAMDYYLLRQEKRRYESDLEELVRQRSAELDRISRYDELTNLPNRAFFEARLTEALAAASQEGQMLAVLLLDVDSFKKINESLGYRIGDRLLRSVAERLKNQVGAVDTVARFGGDGFALLSKRIKSAEDILETVHLLHQALNPHFSLEGQDFHITASIGVSIYPQDGTDAHTLLRNAGAALYQAKTQEGGGYRFYTSDMNARALKRLALENGLRRALEGEGFVLHYQPQVEVGSRQLVGVEALIRWQQTDAGLVPPMDFIPLAEDAGLIAPIGEWVLRAACLQSQRWAALGALGPLRISVNLSAYQFRRESLSKMVSDALSETGLQPERLCLELTESSIMVNAESAVGTLNELKEIGVRVAIDDFGTGYSSLGYLKRLPIDILKIDKSFVRDTPSDPDSAALVKAIITLAHNLRLRVIAEGVEREEQLEFLRTLRCDEAQGHLFSRPLPEEDLNRWLRKEKK
ncbi:MAG TPA: EAL domain-containing protein [Pyrinomonadaceae bacterium]|jgi:diguanylate cyclase (GGDEF)-like protein